MHLTTSLPFPHLTFKHWAPDDCEVAVVIVKGTFGINGDGQLGVTRDQAPILEVDAFWGAPNASSLRAEQELAPAKPATDLTITATARAPGGEALPDWPVSVEVEGRLFYTFQVRGPAHWAKESGRWRLSDPAPVTEVPIRYELAFGGSAPGEDGPVFHDHNPVGRGFVTDRLLEGDEPIPAPQIGDLAEFIAGDIRAPMTVHGLGPIAKAWLPRRSAAGTFDDAWKATRHPRMPKDYALAFWNAAPRRLQLTPPLDGGERVILRGLQHDPAPITFVLPQRGVALYRGGPDGAAHPLPLTDVLVDVSSADPHDHRVTLIWRDCVADLDAIDTLHMAPAPLETPQDEQISHT